MSGAACLSAKSAYRSGAGLVEVYTVEENRPIVQTLVPEAVVTVYTPAVENGSEQEEYEGLLKRAAVLVAGPGLSTEPYAGKLLAGLLQEAKKRENISILEYTTLVDIIEEHNQCVGAVIRKNNEKKSVKADYVVDISSRDGQILRT